MQFTVLTVNPGGFQISLNDLAEHVKEILPSIIPITYVPYASFKLATESEPISLYIMDKKDKSVMTKEMKDVREMRSNFFGKQRIGSYTAPMSHSFNPRYMVLDVHDISDLTYKDRFAIRILMSSKIPVSHYIIAREIADSLSEKYQSTVFSISKEKNLNVECVTSLHKKQVIHHSLSRENSGVIGRYTKNHGMSINKILARLDQNIETLMAPKDLEEYEGALRDQESSMEYIKTLPDSEQSKEMRQVRTDIIMIKSEIASILSRLKEDPKVISHYIRVFDPAALSKYKRRDVELTQSQQEVWS